MPGPWFSLNCRKYLKTRAQGEGFSTLIPMDSHQLDSQDSYASRWHRLTAVLIFGLFNRPKKNSNSTQFIQGLQSRWNLYSPMVRRQISSLSPSSSPCQSSVNHSRRLFQMTFLGFYCKINGRAGAALQQKLGRVGLASTNTRRFRVSGSRCWQQPTRFRKTCYHSCDTDSVQESKKY